MPYTGDHGIKVDLMEGVIFYRRGSHALFQKRYNLKKVLNQMTSKSKNFLSLCHFFLLESLLAFRMSF